MASGTPCYKFRISSENYTSVFWKSSVKGCKKKKIITCRQFIFHIECLGGIIYCGHSDIYIKIKRQTFFRTVNIGKFDTRLFLFDYYMIFWWVPVLHGKVANSWSLLALFLTGWWYPWKYNEFFHTLLFFFFIKKRAVKHCSLSFDLHYYNVSSTKTNRLLQEEINATLMCHLW